MHQRNTSSVVHAASIVQGTSLTISQLIRIERHRGGSYSALHGTCHEHNPQALHCGVNRPSRPTSQLHDAGSPADGTVAATVTLQANVNILRPSGPGSSSGLLHISRNSRLAHCCRSPVGGDTGTGKLHRRHATQTNGPSPPMLKDASKRSLSTQTLSSSSRTPLVRNKLPGGLTSRVNSVKRVDVPRRGIDPGEIARPWPKSGRERQVEIERREEARLLKEEKERQARERVEHEAAVQAAVQAAIARRRLEEARRHAEESALRLKREVHERRWEARVSPAIKCLEAVTTQLSIVRSQIAELLHQRELEWREYWEARISPAIIRLERVTAQLSSVRSQIAELLHQCELERTKLWERKAKRFELACDELAQKKERTRRLVATYSESSTVLSEAIADFCEVVSKDVNGKSHRHLVPTFRDLLPRHMFAPTDTPARKAQLCAIFWTLERVRHFEQEMQLEAHIWRHYYAARRIHGLHPEAFSFATRYAIGYCAGQRFVNGADNFYQDYAFWEDHTELVSPPRRSRFSPKRVRNTSTDPIASQTARMHLAYLLKDMAKNVKRELASMLDRGNFVIGQQGVDLKRQQQVALRKPFTLVRQNFIEMGSEVISWDREFANEEASGLWDTREVRAKLKTTLGRIGETTRSYLVELDILTYWNWLATERNIPQRRMSYREITKSRKLEADVARKESTPVFKNENGPDNVWRYTNFRGPDGQQVVVDYCVTRSFAERTASLFTNSKVIGIDLWGGRRFASVEDAVREGKSAKRCVPMVAIATHDRIAMFHFAAMGSDSYTLLLPTLVRVLEDPTISKVGENIHAFRQRLLTHVGISMEGAVDLESMVAQSSRSPETNNSIDYSPALARPQSPTDIYPPEPPTAISLSHQLLKYTGQSLCEDMINSGDLQGFRLRSPKLLQLSASRPYAALQLHHTLSQSMHTGSQESLPLSPAPESVEKSKGNLISEPAGKSELASLSSQSRVAEHDLGPTNIDPWSRFRDDRLRDLATALAKVFRGNNLGTIEESHLAAYVLFTRFGQTTEDIVRILDVPKPTERILDLLKTTDLPFSEEMMARLRKEMMTPLRKETETGVGPEERATQWIQEMIKDSPARRRMFRRRNQLRKELTAYAMWHHLQMKVAEIAQKRRLTKKEVFVLIMKTLTYGKPYQRPRYLELLSEYAPGEYRKELERTRDNISSHSTPRWAATDVLPMSGTDPFDEGEFEKEADPPEPVKVPKKAKAPTTRKRLDRVKLAFNTTKATLTSRGKATSPSKRVRTKRSKIRTCFSEKRSMVRRVGAEKPEATAAGLAKSSHTSSTPGNGFGLQTKPGSEKTATPTPKKKSDLGDSNWLQETTAWPLTEHPAVNTDTVELGAPDEQPKISPNSGRRRRARRAAARSSSAMPIDKTVTASSGTRRVLGEVGEAKPLTQTPSQTFRMYCVDGRDHANQSLENPEARRPNADPPTQNLSSNDSLKIKRYTFGKKDTGSTHQTRVSTAQSVDPEFRFSMNGAPRSSSEIPASGLRKRERLRAEVSQEQKPPRGVVDLSATIEVQDVSRTDSGA